MPSRLSWHGQQAIALLDAELFKRISAACIVVKVHAKKLVGIEGTKRSGKGKSGKLVYNANPAPPGHPPHKQTGRGQASIAHEVDRSFGRVLGRVGTNVKYMRLQELGTSKMKARPWLRRALAEMQSRIQTIMRQPLR